MRTVEEQCDFWSIVPVAGSNLTVVIWLLIVLPMDNFPNDLGYIDSYRYPYIRVGSAIMDLEKPVTESYLQLRSDLCLTFVKVAAQNFPDIFVLCEYPKSELSFGPFSAPSKTAPGRWRSTRSASWAAWATVATLACRTGFAAARTPCIAPTSVTRSS